MGEGHRRAGLGGVEGKTTQDLAISWIWEMSQGHPQFREKMSLFHNKSVLVAIQFLKTFST